MTSQVPKGGEPSSGLRFAPATLSQRRKGTMPFPAPSADRPDAVPRPPFPLRGEGAPKGRTRGTS